MIVDIGILLFVWAVISLFIWGSLPRSKILNQYGPKKLKDGRIAKAVLLVRGPFYERQHIAFLEYTDPDGSKYRPEYEEWFGREYGEKHYAEFVKDIKSLM